MVIRVLAVIAGVICCAVAVALTPVLALAGVGAGLVAFGLVSDFSDKAAP